MVYSKIYDNGLRLVVKRMDGLLSVTMGILVGTGAAYETDKENGISHFIEHTMFKGTKTRSSFELSEAFDVIGAQVNAFTGKDLTCYYAKSTSDRVEQAFELLSDQFVNSIFPEDELEKEKGVVCEEIAMNEDTPDDLCLDQVARAFYGESNYGRDILGTSENVQSFTREDIFSYIEDRYTPDNIVISFAGNIDMKTADELVEKYLSVLKKRKSKPRVLEIKPQNNSLVTKKDIEQMHFAIAYKSFERDNRLMIPTQIVNSVFGTSMSSRLFQRIREKLGLAYSVSSYTTSYKEMGNLVIYAGVNSKKLYEAYEAILNEVELLKTKGISIEEFTKAKEQLKANTIFAQESTSSQMILYGKEMLYFSREYDFEGRIADLVNTTMDDVNEAIVGNFNSENMALSLVGNTKKPLEFIK